MSTDGERPGRRYRRQARLGTALPTGFEWGYRRAGPSDLALNILFYATGDREFAGRHFERFCDEVVGRIPHRGGVLRVGESLVGSHGSATTTGVREAVSRPEDDGPE